MVMPTIMLDCMNLMLMMEEASRRQVLARAVGTLFVMLMTMLMIVMVTPTIILDCMNLMMMMEEAFKRHVLAMAAATLFDSMIMMVIAIMMPSLMVVLKIGFITRCKNFHSGNQQDIDAGD